MQKTIWKLVQGEWFKIDTWKCWLKTPKFFSLQRVLCVLSFHEIMHNIISTVSFQYKNAFEATITSTVLWLNQYKIETVDSVEVHLFPYKLSLRLVSVFPSFVKYHFSIYEGLTFRHWSGSNVEGKRRKIFKMKHIAANQKRMA